ncbi:MAG: ftsW [Rickettsiales bacterium]|jgi:cell division protein FtsW|nr:ftsW [Rickettsiales bacterium]
MKFNRQNSNIFSTWWWTIDRITLFTIAAIILIGIVLVSTASPAVAERIGLDGFFFVRRQFAFLIVAVVGIFAISLPPPIFIRRIAFLGYAGGIVALVGVLLFGQQIKGATQWISIAGVSLQPSEFVKPFFAVLTAWLLARKGNVETLRVYYPVIISYVLFIGLLLLQPDFGMTVTVSLVWGIQLFLSGLPIIWIMVGGFLGIGALLCGYSFFPHVAKRINSFLDPSEKGYQVEKSLEAFNNGGFFGKGPGEGTVKQYIPDSHTDFIFSVAGEELGLLVCIVLVGLFAFLVFRSLMRAFQETDLFTLYAVVGLASLIGIQALVNMAVTLNLIPNTGMTLPFISYGGSSLLATGLTVGMLLGLTRKRFGQPPIKTHAAMRNA